VVAVSLKKSDELHELIETGRIVDRVQIWEN